MKHTITQLLLSGLLAVLALAGLAGCTDEYANGNDKMVPLRLAASYLPVADTLQTRSTGTRATSKTFDVKVALSVESGKFAEGAKDYVATDNGSGKMTFAPKTEADKLVVSYLQGSTPLSIWGEHPDGKPLYCSYATATLNEGACFINMDDARSQAAVRVKKEGKYMTAATVTVSSKSLTAPKMENGKYTWKTTGSKPALDYTSGTHAASVQNTAATAISYVQEAEWMTFIPCVVTATVSDVFTITIGSKSYDVGVPDNQGFTFSPNTRYLITVDLDKEVSITDIEIEGMSYKEDIEIRDPNSPGIYCLKDLKDFRDAWNANGADGIAAGKYKDWVKDNVVNLYADIDMNAESDWTPIGPDVDKAFKGSFNGNGHTISNLTQTTLTTHSGIFGIVNEGSIKNLTVDNVTFMATGGYVSFSSLYAVGAGGIAGGIKAGDIVNCHVRNSFISASEGAYGIAASCGGVKIIACTVDNTTITDANTNESSYSGPAGIAQLELNDQIVGCVVSSCTINTYGIAAATDMGVNPHITGSVAYNIALTLNSPNPVCYGNTYELPMNVSGTYFYNISNSGGNAFTDFWNYTASSTDLCAKIPALNSALYNYSSTFGYHYEEVNGYPALVEGSPTAPGIYTAQDLIDFSAAWVAGTSGQIGADGIAQGKYDAWLQGNVINLYADIDMTGVKEWIPIGPSRNDYMFKNLTFEGNGHTIRNLTTTITAQIGGIFGFVAACTIQNLTVENMSLTKEGGDIGGIVGYIEENGVVISNCHVKGCTFKGYQIGGISVSSYDDTRIEACTVSNTNMTGTTITGISSPTSETKIVGCIVHDCTFTDAATSGSSISGISKDYGAIGCAAYNLKMVGNDTGDTPTYYPILGGYMIYPIVECNYYNVTKGPTNSQTLITNEDGYCANRTDFVNKIGTMNDELKKYSSTFGYHYEMPDGYPVLVPDKP